MDSESDSQTCRSEKAEVGTAALRPIRPYAVLNGYGEQLATFTEWADAHAWAHATAKSDDAILPLEVEDRSQRITRRITRETCELIAWTIFTKISGCDPGEEPPTGPPYS